MKTNRIVTLGALLLLICSLLISACDEVEAPKPGPEVGSWHAEYTISSIDDTQMSPEDKLLLSLLAGNIVFEADVEFFEDGTFTYTLNTDEIENAIKESTSTIIGLLISTDISLFTDRLIQSAFQGIMHDIKSDYVGTYTATDDGLITATDGSILYFKITAGRLIQIDKAGNAVLTFKKSK